MLYRAIYGSSFSCLSFSIIAGVVGISAIWAGAREVALTDGAFEVLNIAKENLLENCPPATMFDKKKFSIFYEESSLQENTIFCSAWRQSESSSPQALVSAPAPVSVTAAAVGRLRWGNSEDIEKWLRWKPGNLISGSLQQPMNGSY